MSEVPQRLARFLDADGRLRLGRVEGAVLQPLRGDLFGALRPIGDPVALNTVTLLPPVLPSKIVIVDAQGRLSLKPSTAVIGHGEAVRLPDGVASVEAHPCIAAVIGLTLSGQTPDVSVHVLGMTGLCDVVAPQHVDWFGGGGFDTFCPLGPWIQLGVSDALCDAVAQVGAVLTLFPGDVVALRAGDPHRVAGGARIRVAVPGLGILENPVVGGAENE